VPAAYSSALRERVIHTVGEGTSRRGAAGVFKVSVSTAIRWTKRLAASGWPPGRFAAAPGLRRLRSTHGPL
jgi:transposase